MSYLYYTICKATGHKVSRAARAAPHIHASNVKRGRHTRGALRVARPARNREVYEVRLYVTPYVHVPIFGRIIHFYGYWMSSF